MGQAAENSKTEVESKSPYATSHELGTSGVLRFGEGRADLLPRILLRFPLWGGSNGKISRRNFSQRRAMVQRGFAKGTEIWCCLHGKRGGAHARALQLFLHSQVMGESTKEIETRMNVKCIRLD